MDDDEFGELYADVLNFPSSNPTVAATPINVYPVESYPNSDSISLGNPKPPPPPPESLVEEESIQLDGFEDGIEGAGVAIPPAVGTVDDDNSDSSSDSDSEDDLKIVLNDTDPNGSFIDDHVVDEEHKPLVIGADDAAGAGSEEPDWGEDRSADAAAAAAAGAGAGAKPPMPTNPSLPSHPRPNYAPYHSSFHSQFKYVRPGAAPGGAPGPVRPAMSIPLLGGRGRGDLRPPGLKGPGFWGGPAPPRGLDFTLPSHKTIFEVDIENFEEKPWKYPGVDVSDYFNFSLNEERWKDYCKQVELTRLESTMQSRILVYESGRAEQEFDPDLPPELAAAASINDSPIEKADNSEAEGRLGDPVKGDARTRSVLLTGRAIQVETGFGERLPSADTRPPRVRDSDSVIEIVLQDSSDDESAGNSDTANQDDDSERGDEQIDGAIEDGSVGGDDDFDGNPPGGNVTMKDAAAKKTSPSIGSPCDDVHDKERDGLSPERASSDHHSGSKDHNSTENVRSPCKKRWTTESACEGSPHVSSGESAHDRRSLGYQREDSADSIEQKRSPKSLSLAPVIEAVEASVEGKAMTDADNTADGEIRKEKEDNVVVSTGTSHNKHRICSAKQHKLSCPVEPSTTKGVDDVEDLEASRSSDTSKATGNSRDHLREGVDKESKQDGPSAYMGNVKRHHGEGGHDSRRKDLDDRMDMDRSYVSAKGREEHYSHKEWDPHTGNHCYVKPEGVDRRERDYPEAGRQRRNNDPHGRTRVEDPRKPEHGEEMVSRHRRKVTEIDKSDKVEYIQSQKKLENGNWRIYHEKDAGSRYREKDDALKSHQEVFDDHRSKRKKDDDFMRTDHVDKQEMSRSLRESAGTRGKLNKEGRLNQRKRDDHLRVRDAYDNHHAVRRTDEDWAQRERAEQQRERDEWYRAKQSYDENLSRRDRGEGHAVLRRGRAVVDKVWPGHCYGREEYSYDRDAGRHDEQLKRRERDEEEISLQHRGGESVYTHGQIVNESKRPRQEKSTFRNDRAISASDNQTFREEELKENSKKARESDSHTTSGTSKRHQGEKGIANEMGDVKSLSGKAGADHEADSLHNLSREGVSSDDEQRDSRRGRSKLERWASHKDRDRDINPKSSSSLKSSKSRNVSGSTTVVHEESGKHVEVEDGRGVKESGEGSEVKDADANHRGRADTAEKLKRRRERFKFQLESDSANKKAENESTSASQNEAPENAEVKQERPPRKRRWLNS